MEAAAPASICAARLIALNRESRGLSLRAGLISAAQAGDYQAAVKGRGMEYDESRPYQAGDEIRHIDWRVTARTGKAHTKLFREERERPVWLWIDFRAPMFFATRGRFKSVLAAELAALFAWTAARQGDRVGGMVFAEATRHELRRTPCLGPGAACAGGRRPRARPARPVPPGPARQSGHFIERFSRL